MAIQKDMRYYERERERDALEHFSISGCLGIKLTKEN